MRAVVQRVDMAEIKIEYSETKTISKGLVVYLGVMSGDSEKEATYLANKISDLRIFTDENDKLNLSLKDFKGDILIVSNFTLAADCRKGRRPSFENAERPEKAEVLYDYFVKLMKEIDGLGKIETGEFGAHMDILSSNSGPINLIMDTNVIQK
ncbi:MAG: D-aminoacyl-tRNA deacylase [Clostridia bacterium]